MRNTYQCQWYQGVSASDLYTFDRSLKLNCFTKAHLSDMVPLLPPLSSPLPIAFLRIVNFSTLWVSKGAPPVHSCGVARFLLDPVFPAPPPTRGSSGAQWQQRSPFVWVSGNFIILAECKKPLALLHTRKEIWAISVQRCPKSTDSKYQYFQIK